MPPPTGAKKALSSGAPMIRWYHPLLLLRTGARALLATVVGQIADNRELQAVDNRDQSNRWRYGPSAAALGSNSDRSTDQPPPDDDLWIDFVSDPGDGWAASFAVASAVARPSLSVDGVTLPRAQLLLLGGDQVYPDPSIKAYQTRALAPYNAACESVNAFAADVFALPGNHDWYDGLHAFQDIFCHDSPTDPEWSFGHWRKRQSHSYFSWQLPQGWWLLAPDVQLDDRLNPAQRTYFREVVATMQRGDRVILVSAHPFWSVYDPDAQGPDALGKVMRWIVELCAQSGATLKLVLTGDLHHYSRYSDGSPQKDNRSDLQLVTAGGGGAFLHPTHTLAESVTLQNLAPEKDTATEFVQQAVFPSKRDSRKLSLRNLYFPILNWELSLFIGFVYTMLAWILETRMLVGTETASELFQSILASHNGLGPTLNQVVTMIPKSPEFALVVLLTALGLTAFNENCSGKLRLLLGAFHTVLHLAGLIITMCVAISLTGWMYDYFDRLSFSFFWFLLTMICVGGGVGGVVIGVYLTLSLNFFGANMTNAFSSLRIADYKNFLRLKIASDGTLTVYPLGIEKVNGSESNVRAIEEPFTIN